MTDLELVARGGRGRGGRALNDATAERRGAVQEVGPGSLRAFDDLAPCGGRLDVDRGARTPATSQRTERWPAAAQQRPQQNLNSIALWPRKPDGLTLAHSPRGPQLTVSDICTSDGSPGHIRKALSLA